MDDHYCLCCLPLFHLARSIISSPSRHTPPRRTIMVDPRVTQLFPNSLVPDASRDPSWVENQIGVLKSQGVAAYVVKQLRLADDPEFLREDPGVFASMLEYFGVTAGLKKIGLGGALTAVGLAESDRQRSEAERIGEAQGAFTRRIDVKRVGLSNMLRVEFRSRPGSGGEGREHDGGRVHLRSTDREVPSQSPRERLAPGKTAGTAGRMLPMPSARSWSSSRRTISWQPAENWSTTRK